MVKGPGGSEWIVLCVQWLSLLISRLADGLEPSLIAPSGFLRSEKEMVLSALLGACIIDIL